MNKLIQFGKRILLFVGEILEQIGLPVAGILILMGMVLAVIGIAWLIGKALTVWGVSLTGLSPTPNPVLDLGVLVIMGVFFLCWVGYVVWSILNWLWKVWKQTNHHEC